MRQRGAFVAVLATVSLVTASCENVITGSGRIVTRTFPVSGFTRLDVSAPFAATVAIGEAESLVVDIDDNLVDRLDIGVTDEQLHLGLKPGIRLGEVTMRARIVMVKLTAVRAERAAIVTLPALVECDRLDVNLDGAAQLKGALRAGVAIFGLSGAAQADLRGAGDTVTIQASGASELSMADFDVGTMTVTLSGASLARVSVTDQIAADVSGASQLLYRGNPRFTKRHTSGAATIESF